MMKFVGISNRNFGVHISFFLIIIRIFSCFNFSVHFEIKNTLPAESPVKGIIAKRLSLSELSGDRLRQVFTTNQQLSKPYVSNYNN